jgi:hypothetical protein
MCFREANEWLLPRGAAVSAESDTESKDEEPAARLTHVEVYAVQRGFAEEDELG